uniref:LRRCT domain-containing protein n=1 Tax=Branchiostoma floridae TaxID=7739 RepID=C3ZJK8_BRAFL|eukprot:XP_002591339.1 hypothetical protein BRAFLDRAFT_76811 [Branchiostoma floridae]
MPSLHCHCPGRDASGPPCSWAGYGGTYSPPVCLRTLPTGFGKGTRLVFIKSLRSSTLFECSFPNASGVYSLRIELSNVSVIQTGAFRGMPSVQTLSLADNRIFRLDCDTFIGAEYLKYLHLYKNAISYISRYAFRGLPVLQEVHLNHNDLTSVPIDALLQPTALTYVNLNANHITRIDSHVMCLTQNQRLYLTLAWNKLNCDKNLTWFVCNLPQLALIRYRSSLRCESPAELRGTFLATLKNDVGQTSISNPGHIVCSEEAFNSTDAAGTSSESPQLVSTLLCNPRDQTALTNTYTETPYTSEVYNVTILTESFAHTSHINSTPVSSKATEMDYVILFKGDPVINLDDGRTKLITMICAVLVPLLLVLASVIVVSFFKHCHQIMPPDIDMEDQESRETEEPYAIAYFGTEELFSVTCPTECSRPASTPCHTSDDKCSTQSRVELSGKIENVSLRAHAVVHQEEHTPSSKLPQRAPILPKNSGPKLQSKTMTLHDDPCPELHHDHSGPELKKSGVTNDEVQLSRLQPRVVDELDDDPGPELHPYAVTYDTGQCENDLVQPYAIAYLHSQQSNRRDAVEETMPRQNAANQDETITKQLVSRLQYHSASTKADIKPKHNDRSISNTTFSSLEDIEEDEEEDDEENEEEQEEEKEEEEGKRVNKNKPSTRDDIAPDENATTQNETFAKQPLGHSGCQSLPSDEKIMKACGKNGAGLDHSLAKGDTRPGENVANEEETIVKQPVPQSDCPSLSSPTNTKPKHDESGDNQPAIEYKDLYNASFMFVAAFVKRRAFSTQGPLR